MSNDHFASSILRVARDRGEGRGHRRSVNKRNGKVIRAHAFFDSLPFNDLWRRVKP
jgi:hypothetical protein